MNFTNFIEKLNSNTARIVKKEDIQGLYYEIQTHKPWGWGRYAITRDEAMAEFLFNNLYIEKQ